MLDVTEVPNPHGLRVPDIRTVRGELRYDAPTVTVARTTRSDPLGDMHAKGLISEAQYAAGRQYQATREAMGIGRSRSPSDIKEHVDGGHTASDGLTQRKMDAAKQVEIWRLLLGRRSYEICEMMLIKGEYQNRVALLMYLKASRANVAFVGRTFREALDVLAADMGLGA